MYSIIILSLIKSNDVREGRRIKQLKKEGQLITMHEAWPFNNVKDYLTKLKKIFSTQKKIFLVISSKTFFK